MNMDRNTVSRSHANCALAAHSPECCNRVKVVTAAFSRIALVSRRGEPRLLVVHCGRRTRFLSRGFVREQSRLDCLELALGERALRPQPRDFLELLAEFRR